ncbi:MAG: zinc ribbon domain-containing protein, partial [Odoribacter sp.]|nr:zinc ribbon domain-containing protein [Odoribacter sp.]
MNNSNEVKQCPYCGEDIPATAKLCKHCGEWLNETESHEHKQQGKIMVKNVPQTKNPPSNSKFWKIICIIEGIVIVALLLGIDNYYLLAGTTWTPNSDFSEFIAIVSDDAT